MFDTLPEIRARQNARKRREREERARKLTQVFTIAGIAVGMVAGGVVVGLGLAANSQAMGADLPPTYRLALLVNLPDGRQTDTTIAAGLADFDCVPMMAAVWRANADAAPVAFDVHGPIPAFDAACIPE